MKTNRKFTRRQSLKLFGFGATGIALSACAAPRPATQAPGAEQPAQPAADGGKLEIFSWWTSGGEVEALEALYKLYREKYPNVEIINAALAGGAGQGGNMKAVLETRMIGGDPPDSFQVHLGQELIGSHVKAGRMEDLSDLYASEGWNNVFPKGLIELASYEGKPYSVPVNIHRSNVMWYNTNHLAEAGLDKPPATWDEWFDYAEKLKAKGIGALAVAGADPNFSAHVFENILVATLGPEKYTGLFNGATAWDDPGVKEAMDILLRSHEYAQADYLSVAWGDINEVMTSGKASTMIMGDWTHGLFKSAGFKDYGWAPAPGTNGVFVALSDSFGLPKNVKHRENVINWLKLCGSREGQDAFNPIKGSIPARTDPDLSKYDDYLKQTIEAFKTNTIVGSIQHGAAAPQGFVNDYDTIVSTLLASKDTAAAMKELVAAAKTAGLSK
ncbi:MAG: ABC transporter substrate-binding protein [Anaerolineae bacterium]|nr:ABC transporter substrate-binding protein [Thermoflexales bacterium]MDW8408748.1 ABC transporter substrate-binding protein [Anaerolineae bacterium]